MDTMESAVEQLRAAGTDVMNLAVDDMVFPAPAEAIDLASQYMEEGGGYYTRPEGHPILRQAILTWLAEQGHVYTDDELVVGPGSRSLLYLALSAMSNKRGEVVIFAPFPPEYPSIITMSRLAPRIVPLQSPFKLSVADIEQRIPPDAQVICVQSPAQPTGMTVDQDVMHRMLQHSPDAFIIWDRLYSGLSYRSRPDIPHIDGVAKQRILVVGSFSMAFAMSGWRIGYAYGPRSIVSEMVSTQVSLALQPSAFLQRRPCIRLSMTKRSVNLLCKSSKPEGITSSIRFSV